MKFDFITSPKHALLAGVDEAGRGPLAGPVVAAAVILPAANAPGGLADSKALSEKRRRNLYSQILQTCSIGIGIAEPAEIDQLNILQATLTAMRRAVLDLRICPEEIMIDGNQLPDDLPAPAEAVVQGDQKIAAISAASIVAKTLRDHLMIEAENRWPNYGFAKHKGYPSPSHKQALNALGPCPIHRMSYAPVRLARESRQSESANHCG